MSDNEAKRSHSSSPIGNNKGSVSPRSDRSWSHGTRSRTSRSPSRSPRHSPHHSPRRSPHHSPHHSPRRSPRRSPRHSRSHSPSASPPKRGKRYHSRSGSRSRSPVQRKKRRSYSRSRSRSFDRRRRSRSRSPYYRRRRRYSPYSRRRSRSRSPYSSRRGRPSGNRYDPSPSKVVGVFGLSMYTNERDLRDMFTEYGPIKEVQIIYDHQTGRSRGFGFIYFDDLDDAIEAKEQCNGIEVDGRKIRVDYSITKRAHTPTPGVYMGNSTSSSSGGRHSRGEYRERDHHRDRDYDRYERSRY